MSELTDNPNSPSLKVHEWNNTIPVKGNCEIKMYLKVTLSQMSPFTYKCNYSLLPDFNENYGPSEFPKEISGEFKTTLDKLLTEAIQQLANNNPGDSSWKQQIIVNINQKSFVVIFSAEPK